jgi:hypothetical protein
VRSYFSICLATFSKSTLPRSVRQVSAAVSRASSASSSADHRRRVILSLPAAGNRGCPGAPLGFPIAAEIVGPAPSNGNGAPVECQWWWWLRRSRRRGGRRRRAAAHSRQEPARTAAADGGRCADCMLRTADCAAEAAVPTAGLRLFSACFQQCFAGWLAGRLALLLPHWCPLPTSVGCVLLFPLGFFAACCAGLAGRPKPRILGLGQNPPSCCGGRRFLRRAG